MFSELECDVLKIVRNICNKSDAAYSIIKVEP
jgi:hypothetical protein